ARASDAERQRASCRNSHPITERVHAPPYLLNLIQLGSDNAPRQGTALTPQAGRTLPRAQPGGRSHRPEPYTLGEDAPIRLRTREDSGYCNPEAFMSRYVTFLTLWILPDNDIKISLYQWRSRWRTSK